jgi:hypothetical protein
MAGGRLTLYFRGFALSYRPPMGLAAARMEARAFRVAYRARRLIGRWGEQAWRRVHSG